MGRHKPYHVRPLNVSVIKKKETPVQGSETKTHQKQEHWILSNVLSSAGDLLAHSYREQTKNVLIYLMESEHIKVDSKEKQIIIQGEN